VLVVSSSGQVFVTASSAIGGGGSIVNNFYNTASFIATGSITASVNVTGSSIFQITSGSSTFIVINNSGSVGIGTNTPSSKLEVSASTSNTFVISGVASSATNLISVTGSGGQILKLDTNATATTMSLKMNGIGNTSTWDFITAGGTNVNGGSNNNYIVSNQYADLNVKQYSALVVQQTGTPADNPIVFQVKDSSSKKYLQIDTGSTTISGSFNANNVLFVSASAVTISGSLSVVSGSTEFQVLGSGIKMGNTGSDAHTMTGSFAIQVTPTSPSNIPGGIKVTSGINNVSHSTNFTIGNYTIVSQRTNELYFGANSPGEAGAYFLGTQMYTGQASPRFILGGATGPNNVSYMSVGANTGSEYQSAGSYPSTENNFFLINTNFSSPNPGTIQRRSLYIGAQDIRFFVSASTNNDTFSSAAPVMTIGSANTVTITGSTSVLTVRGSGSTAPLFTVQGSQVELFSVTDSLSGSLFSVNDISGLPIIDVNSDQTTKIGSYLAPGMYASTKVTANTGVTVIYSIPTASYDSAYFDYNIRLGSLARAGSIIAIWSGSNVNYSEVSASSFGTTNTFVFGVSISGSNMILSGSAPSNGWTVKTIVKAI